MRAYVPISLLSIIMRPLLFVDYRAYGFMDYRGNDPKGSAAVLATELGSLATVTTRSILWGYENRKRVMNGSVT